ncbi:hypothetical protein M378DRAFT_16831 [Amanita muscaria Koide BX008]|uniref:Rab-GAP TBC domain-containing protein n=1 Tax=Amanita muscaria (strain Koide BX008) TaxID=946122 RepID=A0A0C2S221_AMAMK|nr:hypothetical protein M378DRAFT_16831 [Amanita muscaria Koide BX008]
MARMLDAIQLLDGNSEVLDHPLLWVLSAVYHNLASARGELEENSLLEGLYTDGGEEQHDVRRNQGVLVFSLSEAIVDEVPTSRSPANTIHLQSPSRERDGVPPTTVIDAPTIYKQDKWMITDWMGLENRPSPASSVDSNTSSITAAPPSEPTSSGLVVVKQPMRQDAKNDRACFKHGTLEISILNPTISTTPTPTTSVTVPTSTAPAVKRSSTPPTTEEKPASTDTASVHSKMSRKTSATVASTTSTTNNDSSVVLITSLRTTFPVPLASSAQDVSLVSSPSVHEQAGSSDVPSPKNIQGSSLRAIVHATRVMTSDYGSVLVDHGKYISPQVAELAHMLMKQGRDAGVLFREKGNEKLKDAVALTSTKKDDKFRGLSMGEAAMTLRAVARAATTTSATTVNASTPTKRSSVLLESIIPVSAKPPTQYLSKSAISNSYTSNPNRSTAKPAVPGWSAARPYTHTSLAGRRRRSYGKSRSGERGESAERDEWGEKEGHVGGESEDRDNDGALLTDRFGFVYDVSQYDVLLLLRARDCKSTAPACLTGVKIADRQEDNNWPDAVTIDLKKMTKKELKTKALQVEDHCSCDGSLVDFAPGPGQYAESVRSTSSGKSKRQCTTASSTSNSNSNSDRQVIAGGSFRTSLPTALSISATAVPPSATSVLSVTSDTPQHALQARRCGTRSSSKGAVWAEPRHVSSFTGSSATMANGGASLAAGGVAAILGMEIIGGLPVTKEERKEFDRLVRNGIPLICRAKVWLECSGGSEIKEPGLFQELLAVPQGREGLDGDDGPGNVVAEIKKDAGRTRMPLNVFLQVVLNFFPSPEMLTIETCHSRNPAVGYCQGMNLVAACICRRGRRLLGSLERILPEDFFSPSLLPSRHVHSFYYYLYVQEYIPKLYTHLHELDDLLLLVLILVH